METQESKKQEIEKDTPEIIRAGRNILPTELSEICSIFTVNGKRKILANRDNGWRMVTRMNTRYHRYTDGPQGPEARFNRKFIRNDEEGGSVEAVICFPPTKDPYLVTDDVNGGTYNFVSPIRSAFPYITPHILLGHWKRDLLPYLKNKRSQAGNKGKDKNKDKDKDKDKDKE